jgi:hypothetical protein
MPFIPGMNIADMHLDEGTLESHLGIEPGLTGGTRRRVQVVCKFLSRTAAASANVSCIRPTSAAKPVNILKVSAAWWTHMAAPPITGDPLLRAVTISSVSSGV